MELPDEIADGSLRRACTPLSSIKDPQIKGCDVLKAYIDNAILPAARD